MTRPKVAIMYDFDKTLCTKNMQEYGFIDSLGIDPSDFWREVTELTNREEMDNILAYMYMMVRKAGMKNVKISKESFEALGKNVEFFRGVDGWFDRIDSFGESCGVTVEHYIVSSGIKEIIEGTSIADRFRKIYACEFMYDEHGAICWPKFAVNYTAKTQFLFRINKGVLRIDASSARKLNQYTPEESRPVPFRNMIYIGDGITDVPCMKLVRSYGGNSIAVYGEIGSRAEAKKLLENDRVNFVVPADYREGSELDQIVKAVMKKIKAVEELRSYAG